MDLDHHTETFSIEECQAYYVEFNKKYNGNHIIAYINHSIYV